jgi:hypothetical protein
VALTQGLGFRAPREARFRINSQLAVMFNQHAALAVAEVEDRAGRVSLRGEGGRQRMKRYWDFGVSA